ncbi:MAG: HD domain-containing protein [Candidatus Omnitrophota bacterium]|jgi:putative nucleotidyltransferase with HDIG domain
MLKFPKQDRDLMQPAIEFAKKRKVKLYLVGGALRDLILGRVKENPDFDFALKKGAISFGGALAQELSCGFVILDKEHGACRLVRKLKHKICTYDFTDFRGINIEDDLLHRDFNINALGLEARHILSGEDLSPALIDPYAAREAINKKIIKEVNKGAFKEDSLRVLRAFSFASVLKFKIQPSVFRLIPGAKNKLKLVSGERVRDELFKIFATENSYECFKQLDKAGILKIVFPETVKMRGIGQGPYHHLDVWEHTLETLRQLELLFKDVKRKEINDFLDETISAERKRSALLKLAAFLHDVGKPQTLRHEKNGRITFHGHERAGLNIATNIARRLKLSNDEIHILRRIILWHLRPGYLSDLEILTARAKFRYFRDTAHEALSVLMLSLADQRATKGPLTTALSRTRHEKTVRILIKELFKKKKEKKQPRLITGDDLIKKFKLKPSVLIGEILSKIEELRAIGKAADKPAALAAAAKLIKASKTES